jgi:hypothetical protein
MPPDRVHRRKVVIDTGDGFSTVALATGEVGPGRVDVVGFCYVAVLTAPAPIEFNTPVRISQAGANTHRGSSRAVRENTARDPRDFYQGTLAARSGFIFFIVTGADLVFLVSPHSRGNFLLSRRWLRQEQQHSQHGY